jgi:sugar lactone lactonase YvrE/ketosteroid isomerase-like protein
MAFRVRNMSVAVVALAGLATLAQAQRRTEVTLSDSAAMPENLTSSRDGMVYFGSTAKGTIYRAAPGAARAEPWILASATGLTNVLGVLADDHANTLWVCQNATGGRGGAPVVGQTALRSFDLKTGAPRGTYPLPPNAGICNDIAVSADGAAYVSESFRGRIHRLRPGATQLETWVTDQQLDVIDGLAFLADGALYANNFTSGKLYRVSVNADGTAGAVVPIETSLPLVRPDGLRTAGPRTLIQAEGQGRVTELTITGNRADVRVVHDNLPGATGVTIVGDNALVLVSRLKGVVVPYSATRGDVPAQPRTNPALEQELLSLSRDKWRWMAERKVDTLAALFHEDAVFVHMGGTIPRNQELEVIRSGGIQYKHAEIQEASVRVIGNTAIVLNKIRLDAVVGGNEVSNPFVVTEVYVQQAGKWRLGSLSFTRLLQ